MKLILHTELALNLVSTIFAYNMASSKDEQVQRPFHFAIIDEIDSVLIDEAKPLLSLLERNQVVLIFTIYAQR